MQLRGTRTRVVVGQRGGNRLTHDQSSSNELMSQFFLKWRGPHKHQRHGLSKTPEYSIWNEMRQRCTNPKNHKWDRYGGRGIIVCERWKLFQNFYADMGPRPDASLTLERIDNDGPYAPWNCKWATRSEQNRNKTKSRAEHDHIARTRTRALNLLVDED